MAKIPHRKITAIWHDPTKPDPDALERAFSLIFRKDLPGFGQSTDAEVDKTSTNAKVSGQDP